VVADDVSLVAIDPTTGSRRTLLTSTVPLSDPAYSSDGTKLAYLQGGGSIRVLDTATGHVRELTTCSCGTSSQLTWSPDGSRLAYTNDYQPEGSAIEVIDADGTHRTQLTHFPVGVFPWEPTWSPDGTRIAFALRDSGGVDVINADGSGLKVILVGQRIQNPDSAGGAADNPEWSPDGSRIAYIWDPVSPFEYQLRVMNPDGSHSTKIWSTVCCVTAEGGPAWSPDATQIATVTFNTLWVMNADGSNPQSLGTVGTGQRPAWQPVP
jgi:Tol biopolymer transport system component